MKKSDLTKLIEETIKENNVEQIKNSVGEREFNMFVDTFQDFISAMFEQNFSAREIKWFINDLIDSQLIY